MMHRPCGACPQRGTNLHRRRYGRPYQDPGPHCYAYAQPYRRAYGFPHARGGI